MISALHWSNKYDANQAKLSKYTKYEENWEKAYDDCYGAEEGKEVKINNTPFARQNDAEAIRYADLKVEERDEDYYLLLSDLDIEYDSLKTMYETLLETKRAEQEALKSAVSNAAQDTGTTSGG